MKVCFDTNVLIDILGNSNDHFYSYAAFDIALVRNFKVFVPITSTADLVYVLPRRSSISSQEAKRLLSQLMTVAELLDARSVDAVNALSSNMPDYEDALIAYSAQRNGVDLIITRNLKDFGHSPVPAMSPRQFFEVYKPRNVDYAAVELSTGQ